MLNSDIQVLGTRLAEAVELCDFDAMADIDAEVRRLVLDAVSAADGATLAALHGLYQNITQRCQSRRVELREALMGQSERRRGTDLYRTVSAPVS